MRIANGKTITLSAYAEQLILLATEIQSTFPMLKIVCENYELWVRGSHCSGTVDLRKAGDVMVPCVRISGGQALSGTLDQVGKGVAAYQCVCDALVVVAQRFGDTQIDMGSLTGDSGRV